MTVNVATPIRHGGHQWIVRARPQAAAQPRLVCIPYAGAGPSALRAWTKSFDRSIDVAVLELPGRDRSWRLPACRSISEIVQAAAPAVLELTDRPYVVFGHSLGALLAFELVRELRRLGASPPQHLFASAFRAPHLPSRLPPPCGLDDEAFVREIRRRYDGIPELVLREPELMAMLLPRLRADFEALEGYQYRPDAPLQCPITTFGGRDDATVDFSDLNAWAQHTDGPFALREWPGGHMFLHASAREMADVIAAALVDVPAVLRRSS